MCIAVVHERLLSPGGQRIAPCGTRQGLMVRRPALRADCTVLLGLGELGTTRYAPHPAGAALRSDKCRESEGEAGTACAPRPVLRCASPQKSPLPGAARREAGAWAVPAEDHERCREDGAVQDAMRL